MERREDWQGAGLPSPRERWADGGEGSAKAPSPSAQPTLHPRAQPTLHPRAQPTLHLHLPLTKGILALTLAHALAPTLAHALTSSSAKARSPESQPTGDRLGLGLDLDALLCTPSTVGVMDEDLVRGSGSG